MLTKTTKPASTKTFKARKQQEDRLLRHLPIKDRRQQEQLRRQILSDPIFKRV